MVESSTPDASTAVLSLTVDAEPHAVFTTFTDPKQLTAWYWPADYAALYETDPRPGGKFKFRSTGMPDGQNISIRGIYGEIRRPELLTFIWARDGDFSPFTQVNVEIRADGTRTTIVVTHGKNMSERQRDEHLNGWHDSLGRLADHLAVR